MGIGDLLEALQRVVRSGGAPRRRPTPPSLVATGGSSAGRTSRARGDNRTGDRSVSTGATLTRGKDQTWAPSIDWRRELDDSFGDGPDADLGHYLEAGHRAVRRRRAGARRRRGRRGRRGRRHGVVARARLLAARQRGAHRLEAARALRRPRQPRRRARSGAGAWSSCAATAPTASTSWATRPRSPTAGSCSRRRRAGAGARARTRWRYTAGPGRLARDPGDVPRGASSTP